MKQIIYQQLIFEINEIDKKINKNKEYNEELDAILEIMVKPTFFSEELSFNEYFNLSYMCFQEILLECEKREEYELCSIIQKIIIKEEDMYVEWSNSLPEDHKKEAIIDLDKMKNLSNRQND